MKYKGSSVYDQPDFFNRYVHKRATGKAPNETLEKPVIDELIAVKTRTGFTPPGKGIKFDYFQVLASSSSLN